MHCGGSLTHKADGTVAVDPEEIAMAWEDMFLAELAGSGSVVPAGGCDATICFTDFVPQSSPVDGDGWTHVIFDSLARLKHGKASGPDGIPPEALRAGGLPFAAHLARVACRIG